MSTERWKRIEELVHGALELSPSRRGPWLDQEINGDESLRDDVDRLLACDSPSKDFLETPAIDLRSDWAGEDSHATESFELGQQIGPYKIEREIGRGGMGAVYLGTRSDDQYRRFVAIKLVHRGMETRDIIRRFRNERQILAALDHPNIARLLDGGATADGLPYLVMEYVEGLPITVYCDRHRLSINDRLQIFRTVCAAVQHAHQNLVVHRDLKPSNILITAEGVPKLLDFGIAKVLNPALSALSMERTRTELRVLTPDYASPEQIRGQNLTTTSDIYSLGVVLYELLTGHRPYHIGFAAPHELARVICEQEPARPSAIVQQTENIATGHDKTRTPVTPEVVSRNRDIQFHSLRRRLTGDLDNIVLKALRKEPNRRYESVSQLSADVQRHLEGLPVIARKDTFKYRSTKFIQRNRMGVAAAGLILLSLLAGIVTTTWQAKNARRQAAIAAAERDRARVEASKSERITSFLQNILGFSDPSWLSSNPNRNREATIADALDEAGRRASSELADQPEVLAAVQFTVGFTYRGLSRYAEAEPLLRSSLDIRSRVFGPDSQEAAQSMVGLAEVLLLKGQYADAEAMYEHSLRIYRTAQANGNFDTRWFPISLNDYGLLQRMRGNATESEKILREGLGVCSKTCVGTNLPTLAIMTGNFAVTLMDEGKLDEAIDNFQKALDVFHQLPGGPRFEMGTAYGNLASAFMFKGDLDKADQLANESAEILMKTVGEKHQYEVYPMIFQSEIDSRKHNYKKAQEEANRAIELQQKMLPAGHIDFGRSWTALGKALTGLGDLKQGEDVLRQAVDVRDRAYLPGHPWTADSKGALGENLTQQKRYSEAEPLLIESYNALLSHLGASDPRMQEAAHRLVKLYEAWNKPESAAKYLSSGA